MATQIRPSVSEFSIRALREAVSGRVIAPGDPDYDAARAVKLVGVDRRPAAIVRAANDADVSQVVLLARDTGMELAVRGGGHSYAGHGVTDGGIVLDLSDMRALDVDADGRSAWAQSGLTTGAYESTVAERGLATGFGDTPSVGIGGLTLGGGIGYLSRKHGLTIDNLLAAEVVTADGRLLRADADTNPDLFWAIRGGGGNFGVATRFRYRLREVSDVVGGLLILPATADAVAGFVEALGSAPDELSAIVNVMNAPPMPFLPPEAHGKIIILANMVYLGDAESGKSALAPFRALAAPLADMLRPMRYTDMFQEMQGPPLRWVGRVAFADGLDRAAAQVALDRLQASTAVMRMVQIRVMGGAIARVPVDATAFPHRDRAMMVNAGALYPNPGEAAVHEAWASDLAAALSTGARGAYANFLGSEDQERVHQAYPGRTWDRLREIKRRYDPTNLFHLNQNVPPR